MGKLKPEWLSNLEDADKICFDGVTVEQCVTCKFIKIVASNSIMMIDMIQKQMLLQCWEISFQRQFNI